MASPKETGGPLVKTGRRAGETRARKKDGTWWPKRSDAGVARGKYQKTRSDKGVPRGPRKSSIVDVALDVVESILSK